MSTAAVKKDGSNAGRVATAKARAANMHPLPLFDEECLLAECEKLGIKTQHCYTMWRYIIQRKVDNVDDIPELPKALYQLVKDKFSLTTSKVIKVRL